jgi:hypothetical protein
VSRLTDTLAALALVVLAGLATGVVVGHALTDGPPPAVSAR